MPFEASITSQFSLVPSYFLARLGSKPSRVNSLSIDFSLDNPGPLSLVNHLPANGKIMRVFQGSKTFQSMVSIMVFQGSQTFHSRVLITVLCFSLLYVSSSSQKVNSKVSSCTNTKLNLSLSLRWYFGTVSRDGYFFEGLNILISTGTVCVWTDGFQGLSLHYNIINFLFTSLKSLTSLNASRNSPQNFLLCDWSMFSSADLSLAAGKMREN